MTAPAMALEDGEPAAGPWEVVAVAELADRLLEAGGSPAGRPCVLAVDGRGGAGKTRLAEALVSHVPRTAVVHTDDLAWHESFFGWTETLVDDVLRPVHAGRAVDLRPRAWVERGRTGSIVVPTGLDVLVVEGCGVVQRALAPWLDASVWMQVDRHEAHRRLLARDGDAPDQLRLIEEWDAEERPLRLQEQPWRSATVVVATAPAGVPVPPGHVAVAPPVR